MPIVTPSYLSTAPMGILRDTGHQTNKSLRRGEVKEIVYPTSPKSLSKKYIEYAVEVVHQDGNGPRSSTTYTGCVVDSMFGTGGDFLHYTLRADTQTGVSKGRYVGKGAKVLLQCVNGSNTGAVIVGGGNDPETKMASHKEKDGHNLLFQFNGIRAIINKDGEFEINFNGATDATGKLKQGVDSENSGGLFQLLKNGNVRIGHDDQVLTLDHAGQSWELKAAKNIYNTADGDWSSVVQGSVNIQARKAVDIQAVDEGITLTAPNVKIGSSRASERLVLGSTYRSAQAEMNQKLTSSLQSIAQTIATMAVNLTTASTALKIPMTGGILASPSFVMMTKDLVQIGQEVAQMVAAIKGFESGAGNFLSKDHTTE